MMLAIVRLYRSMIPIIIIIIITTTTTTTTRTARRRRRRSTLRSTRTSGWRRRRRSKPAPSKGCALVQFIMHSLWIHYDKFMIIAPPKDVDDLMI